MAQLTRRDILRAGASAGLLLSAGGCAPQGPATEAPATGGQPSGDKADLILKGGRFATLDPARPSAEAVAVRGGQILAVGSEREVMATSGPATKVIDLKGRTVIPGLNDSHLHIIRGGLNFNMELRWDGVTSLADAMSMLREQASRTPPPQWVRVVGGFTELQFKEKRLPTLDELNAAAPETPVFVLHLYDRALLNAAALRAVGYTKDTPAPPGGVIERDTAGNPTGLLIAKPNALILYKTLALGPKLALEDQINSSRHFMREMNRLGITSVIDAGGGFQNYPDDYQVIERLHQEGLLTVRIAYNLFTQKAGGELADFQRWIGMTAPGRGDGMYRVNGAGEMLVFSAADFEDFREPRPELPGTMEKELHDVVGLLAKNKWPFRLHATYDETIGRALDVFEQVHKDVPLGQLRWFFDHAETISDRNIERVRALGGGIAVQHRMAYQGEYFIQRYGAAKAAEAPPIRKMLKMGLPVGGGTDGTRVASYNPWVALYWLTTGKTVGGTALSPTQGPLERTEALRLYTVGSAWFSGEDDKKGALVPGMYADLVVLSADYFSVPEEQIKSLKSVLTIVGGKVVYADAPFRDLDSPPPPPSPGWSPVLKYGGYGAQGLAAIAPGTSAGAVASADSAPWGSSNCGCFVF